MILVIPLIELSDGESIIDICCNSENSDCYGKISHDPMLLAMLWRRENAKCLHIVDKDSFAGKNNFLNTNAIMYIIHCVDIPIQYSSQFSSVDECRMLLENGIYRVVIGELALNDPKGIAKLIEDFTPSRVAFQANVDNRFLYFQTLQKEMRNVDYAKYLSQLGANRLIYHCEKWEWNKVEPNYEYLAQFAEESNFKLTIMNGIFSSEHLLNLSKVNSGMIDSCVIGKPLYENVFPCQQIWRQAENEIIGTFLK